MNGDDLIWLAQDLDGEARYQRVRARARRFHLAAGWRVVDDSEVPLERRNPQEARLAELRALEEKAAQSEPESEPVESAPPAVSDGPPEVAAPRRRRTPTPDSSAEEN